MLNREGFRVVLEDLEDSEKHFYHILPGLCSVSALG